VTTATRRLRRASIAGLAASTAAGVAIIATGGVAFAALGTIVNKVDPNNTATTVFPGVNAQATGGYLLDTTNAFAIGDQIVLKLEGPGIDPSQTGKGVAFAAKPALTSSGAVTAAYGTTAAASANGDTTPTFTTALKASNTTAGINDELVITFTNSSTGVAADHFTLTLAPPSVNVGKNVTPGALNVHAYAADGTTSLVAAATVATVSDTKASLTEVSAAPSSAAVALNPITLTEVTAGAFLPAGASTTVTLTLGSNPVGITPLFTAGVTPTITVPTGYTVTPAATTAATTYTFAVTAPATAVAATVVVKGLEVDLTAAGNGVVTLTPSVAGPITIGGSALNAIGVLSQNRVGGIDRYATSSQLFSRGGFANASAVLAGGQGYADGLSATYLAGKLGTRVLLTNPVSLQQSTTLALYGAGVSTVYIVGGTAAVSDTVKSQIAALHVSNNPANALITVVRISGADRYATNNAVDLYLGAGSSTNTAYVASGEGFADSLAIAPAVYTTHNPLVLTQSGQLTSAAESTLVNLGITNVIIVGGAKAVSAATETAIGKISGLTVLNRLAGDDRTLTASAIASYETKAGPGGIAASGTYVDVAGLGFTGQATAWLTNGQGFADALSAGAVAGAGQSPVLLTADANTVGAGIGAYFGGLAGTVTAVNPIGLTGALPVATVNAAIATLS